MFDSLEPITEGEDVYDVKEEPDDDDCDLVGVANNDNDSLQSADESQIERLAGYNYKASMCHQNLFLVLKIVFSIMTVSFLLTSNSSKGIKGFHLKIYPRFF